MTLTDWLLVGLLLFVIWENVTTDNLNALRRDLREIRELLGK